MRSKINVIGLLLVLCITDAYLLSHPNLVGKLGILVYKHNYIKSFPKALLTVLCTVGVVLVISELIQKFVKLANARIVFVVMMALSFIWILVIHKKFSSFSYSITGKAFIYGVYLLPILILGIFSYYFLKCFLSKGMIQENPSDNKMN